MTDQAPPMQTDTAAPPSDGGWFRPWWFWLAPVAALLILLYYPVGMALVHTIDDDPDFGPAEGAVSAQQSRAVAVAAALVRREVDVHKWTPNDPFFQPAWALDNMPAFQQGIVAAVSRFTVEMNDQMGRARSSSDSDSDLGRAAGLLKYPGTIWMFDVSTSWAPTASAEKQYRLAARYLEEYNHRLGRGDAVFERRADALIITLDRIAKDLGAAAAELAARVEERRFVDPGSDDVFYATKGRLYAYSLLLRELGWDYAGVIGNRQVGDAWRRMLDSLRLAAALDPLVVVNGAPDATLLPSHLAAQGFFLMRARTQLAEIADSLSK